MENPLADLDQVAEIADPVKRAREIGRRLGALQDYAELLRKLRQEAVLELRARNLSFGEIGRELGLHRNRVQQIAEGRSGGKGPTKAATP